MPNDMCMQASGNAQLGELGKPPHWEINLNDPLHTGCRKPVNGRRRRATAALQQAMAHGRNLYGARHHYQTLSATILQTCLGAIIGKKRAPKG